MARKARPHWGKISQRELFQRKDPGKPKIFALLQNPVTGEVWFSFIN